MPEREICQNSVAREVLDAPGTTEPIEMQCTLMVSLVTSFGLPASMPTKQHVANWLVADGQVYEHNAGGLDFDVCVQHADADECTESCGSTFLTYRASIVTVEDVA